MHCTGAPAIYPVGQIALLSMLQIGCVKSEDLAGFLLLFILDETSKTSFLVSALDINSGVTSSFLVIISNYN